MTRTQKLIIVATLLIVIALLTLVACNIDESANKKLNEGVNNAMNSGAILAPHQNYCPFCSKENYSSNYRKITSGQYVNPNPSETIEDGCKTTTNAKDVSVVYTGKSNTQDIAVFKE